MCTRRASTSPLTRFVLHGDPPHVDAVFLKRTHPIGEVVGPGLLLVGRQALLEIRARHGRAVRTIPSRVFHPSGRRPRRTKQPQDVATTLTTVTTVTTFFTPVPTVLRRRSRRSRRSGLGSQDEWNHILGVVRHRVVEMGQCWAVVGYVVVAELGGGKVTRIDRDPSQLVAVASLSTITTKGCSKVGVQDKLLVRSIQGMKVQRGRFGKSTAKSFDGLVGGGGVDFQQVVRGLATTLTTIGTGLAAAAAARGGLAIAGTARVRWSADGGAGVARGGAGSRACFGIDAGGGGGDEWMHDRMLGMKII